MRTTDTLRDEHEGVLTVLPPSIAWWRRRG